MRLCRKVTDKAFAGVLIKMKLCGIITKYNIRIFF